MTEQDRAEFEAWFDKQDYSGEVPPSRLAIKILKTQLYGAWLAARRTQDAKVRELVEVIGRAAGFCGGSISKRELMEVHQSLAAQLKEQDDDK